jgi:predicted nucleotidyltransferase
MRQESILGSAAREKVLATLLLTPEQEVHLRSLIRKTGFAPRTVQREVDFLVRQGILKERRDGNRRYLSASRAHPLYAPLRELVSRTVGIVPILRLALGEVGIEFSFVFGSLAEGTADAESDVDLMVVGDIGLRETVRRLREVPDLLGREVNPVVWTMAEYSERRKRQDHFLSRILNGPSLPITGDRDEH